MGVGFVAYILFPCDLTKENLYSILFSRNENLKQKISGFYKNNIDWVKVREIGELDYSQDIIRKDFRRKQKEAV